MIMMGILVGIIAVIGGYFYARWANKKWMLPLRDTPDMTVSELQKTIDVTSEKLPGLGFSLLPIVLPLVLITGGTVLAFFPEFPFRKVLLLISSYNFV